MKHLLKLTSIVAASVLSMSANAAFKEFLGDHVCKTGTKSYSIEFAEWNGVTQEGFRRVAFSGADTIRDCISEEFAAIIHPSMNKNTFDKDQLIDILRDVFFDKGWSNQHGVEGVKVLGLGDSFVTLGLGHGDAMDRVTFYGDDLTAAVIEPLAASNINIKDKKSRLAIFNAETEKSWFWIGGGKSDARKRVSEEFADITGGSKIQGREVAPLLTALTTGRGANYGIEGVTLLGIDGDSFAISVRESSTREERIIFRGQMVIDAISGTQKVTHQGWLHLDMGDSQAGLAYWDTAEFDTTYIASGSQRNESVYDLVGFKVTTDEVFDLVTAALNGALSGVEITNMSADSVTLKVATGSVSDILIIRGYEVADAISAFNAS